jgi:hypothetical protein
VNTNLFNSIPVLKYVPTNLQPWVIIGSLAIPHITRFFHSMASGNGVVGSVRAVLFGSANAKPSVPAV